MNEETDYVSKAAKELCSAIDRLSRASGPCGPTETMNILYSIQRLGSWLCQRGTVPIDRIDDAARLRTFNSALADLKETE